MPDPANPASQRYAQKSKRIWKHLKKARKKRRDQALHGSIDPHAFQDDTICAFPKCTAFTGGDEFCPTHLPLKFRKK